MLEHFSRLRPASDVIMYRRAIERLTPAETVHFPTPNQPIKAGTDQQQQWRRCYR